MKKVQEHYDSVAPVYDMRYDSDMGRAYHQHISCALLESLPPGRSLLDLGCGTGLFMRRYGETGGDAIGLDISRGMIENARGRCNDFEFCMGTAEELPFRDHSFDAISCLLAFSYLRHPSRMLAEASRILRPGGRIAVCTLSRNMLTSLVPAIYRLGELIDIRHVGVGDFGERYYTENEMVILFTEAGFIDISVKRVSFAHISLKKPIFEIARKMEPFVEQRMPSLAYNILVTGKKPGLRSGRAP
ncbi:MAG: methyltransferase domain-containing protein [Methanomicrobiales archaeon]|nr:methyltransferase domain-containing protein [Methanomicrobiales archaeon]MDD1660336.1 methyltransferase domain-containing protein [Methanomicrobiales archaeon]